MKSGMLGAFATLFLGAGWAAAQGPIPAPTPSGVAVPSSLGVPQGAAPLIAADAGMLGEPLVYASGDFLLWKVTGGRIPSTATATPFGALTISTPNPVAGTPQSINLPVFSQSSATFGDGNRTGTGSQTGGQFAVGFWSDPDMTFGGEARFRFLTPSSDSFSVNTSPNNAFVAPTGYSLTTFTPGTAALPPTAIVTTPIILTGTVNGRISGSASTNYYDGELNARCVYLRFGPADFGALAGFRYVSFRDELNINSSVSLTGVTASPNVGVPPGPQNFTYSSVDNTRVYNNFYGGQVGLDMNYQAGSFFLYTRGTIAAGNNHQVAEVNSTGTTTTPTGTTTSGGLLASPSDNGRHTRNELSFIPSAEVKIGYQFNDWLRASVGYGGVFLNSFARAGESTTLNTFNGNASINSTVTPLTVAQPNFRFHDSNVYIQGITFGLEARY